MNLRQLREVLGSAGLNLLATPKPKDNEALRESEREPAVTGSHAQSASADR